MKIAIITCSEHPQGVIEDKPLFDALIQSNINYEICIWDQPNDWSKYDICLLRSVWDYHEKFENFIKWTHEVEKVSNLSNPLSVIEWNSDKKYLQELHGHEINIAPTIWLAQHSIIDLKSELSKLPDAHQYFLKPTVGADSSGTFRFNTEEIEKAQQHLNQWISSHDMMLQSYLPSVESYGEVSLIFIDGKFSHAIRKIPVKGDYRVQDTFGATDTPHKASQQEINIAVSTVDFIKTKFGQLSYARIDLLQDVKNQPVINEIELIEPSLFFHHHHPAAHNLINSLINK